MPFYISIISAMLLYVNTISVMKKIKNREDTAANTIIGSILVAVTIISTIVLFS